MRVYQYKKKLIEPKNKNTKQFKACFFNEIKKNMFLSTLQLLETAMDLVTIVL